MTTTSVTLEELLWPKWSRFIVLPQSQEAAISCKLTDKLNSYNHLTNCSMLPIYWLLVTHFVLLYVIDDQQLTLGGMKSSSANRDLLFEEGAESGRWQNENGNHRGRREIERERKWLEWEPILGSSLSLYSCRKTVITNCCWLASFITIITIIKQFVLLGKEETSKGKL